MKRWSRLIWPASSISSSTGGDLRQVASVASFFVSRIDTAVDKLLDEAIAATNDPARARDARTACAARPRSPTPSSPIGGIKRLFAGPRWERLARRGRQRRSGCFGRAPAPRTRPTATSSTSRS